MAKTVKTTKGDVFLMFTIWNKVPTSKIAADGAKYTQVRKALKKAIKKYLEERVEIEEQAREKLQELDKRHLQPLRVKLEKVEDNEKEAVIKQIKKKSEELNTQMIPFNEKLANLFKAIQKEGTDVVFDNEDFLYFSEFCKGNASDLCSAEQEGQKEKYPDGEAMEKLFDFISSAS